MVAVDPTDTPAFERWQRERAEETLYLNEVFLRCRCVLLTSRDSWPSKCSLLACCADLIGLLALET